MNVQNLCNFSFIMLGQEWKWTRINSMILAATGAFLLLMFTSGLTQAQLTAWTQKDIVIVTERSGAALSNYPLLLNLNTRVLMDQGLMKPDASDLRVASTCNGSTQLDYFIETPVRSDSARIWVKLPSLAASQSIPLYIFYGNPAATAVSDPQGIFAFYDLFNGSTQFSKQGQPYTNPSSCGHAEFAEFNNNGGEQSIELGCYDEGELRSFPLLANGNYKIHVKWRTGDDPFEFNGASYTTYDNYYGASTMTPKRLIVVNMSKLHEKDGKLLSYQDNTEVAFNGAINSLFLSAGSSGSGTRYFTWYDHILVRKYVNPEPSSTYINVRISRTDSDSVICPGRSLTFTATPGLPTYRFFVNGTQIQSGPSNVFTHNIWTDGDRVRVVGLDGSSCADSSNILIIRMQESRLPSAGFYYRDTNLQVNFYDTSGYRLGVKWFFGDGDSSLEVNPRHRFPAPGTYKVCQIAQNACGTDTVCREIQVDCAPLTPAFSYTQDQTWVDFTNLSIGHDSLVWYFGDGYTSTEENPRHNYVFKDTFRACLTTFNDCESDSICRLIDLRESAAVPVPESQVFLIHPNPALSHIQFYHIGCPSFKTGQDWIITDNLGRDLLKGPANTGNPTIISVQSLPAGTYQIRLHGSCGQSSGWFLKQ